MTHFQSQRVETLTAQHYSIQDNVAPISPPIHTSATYLLENAQHGADLCLQNPLPEGQSKYLYSRWANPTTDVVASMMNTLENAEGSIICSSGMSAISTVILGLVGAGDHIVFPECVYSGTHALQAILNRFGVETTSVDSTDVGNYEKAIKPTTKILYGETPSNPTMSLLDLEAFGTLGKQYGITTIVDSTFASPFNQRPLDHGVDIVVHSATKYLGGHSDLIAGTISFACAELKTRIHSTYKILGGVQGAFDSFLLQRGIKTLAVRVARANENAMALATFLESHDGISRVYYPGLASHPQHDLAVRQKCPGGGYGGMIAFEVKGGLEVAQKFVEQLSLINLAVSLGGVESLVEHAASMTHTMVPRRERERAGITDGLIRLSVGIEHIDDLKQDIAQALSNAARTSSRL